jgi:hypothetical protein
VISKVNFTRENLYCLVTIAFFIWRAQYDIRHVATTPLTVSESDNANLVARLTSEQAVMWIFVESAGMWLYVFCSFYTWPRVNLQPGSLLA